MLFFNDGPKRGKGGEGGQLPTVLILDIPSFIQGKYLAVCNGNSRWTLPFKGTIVTLLLKRTSPAFLSRQSPVI